MKTIATQNKQKQSQTDRQDTNYSMFNAKNISLKDWRFFIYADFSAVDGDQEYFKQVEEPHTGRWIK